MTPGGLLGAVLAGGRGRRFGGDKRTVAVGGAPMLLRVVEALAPVVEEVAVVGPADAADAAAGERGGPGKPLDSVESVPGTFAGLPDVVRLRDAVPDRGPVEGLRVALSWGRAREAEGVLVLACDLPLVDRELVEALARAWSDRPRGAGEQGVVPTVGGRLQPLAAVYGPDALEVVVSVLDGAVGGSAPSLREVVDRLDVRHVTPELLGVPPERFMNVNTPAQRERAEDHIRRRAGRER